MLLNHKEEIIKQNTWSINISKRGKKGREMQKLTPRGRCRDRKWENEEKQKKQHQSHENWICGAETYREQHCIHCNVKLKEKLKQKMEEGIEISEISEWVSGREKANEMKVCYFWESASVKCVRWTRQREKEKDHSFILVAVKRQELRFSPRHHACLWVRSNG